MSIRVGHILRHEDESGVSGTGIVAEWIEYSDGEVVVHWLSHTPSTNHYRNFKQVESIHGHGGKTELVTVWEQPRLEPVITVEELGEIDKAPEKENGADGKGPVEKEGKPEKPPANKKTPKKKAPSKKKPE